MHPEEYARGGSPPAFIRSPRSIIRKNLHTLPPFARKSLDFFSKMLYNKRYLSAFALLALPMQDENKEALL